MIKFDKENVIQTVTGDVLSIGVGCKNSPCCDGTFILSMFGNNPRTYHQGKFTKEELAKLGALIQRLTNE